MTDPKFEVTAVSSLVIDAPPGLPPRDLLSPFVWRDGAGYLLLVRAQLPGDAITGRIWLGRSDDGLHFRLDDQPLIAPSLAGLDEGGCEDPTVVVQGGTTYVFYTGVDRLVRGELLLASGPDVTSLVKRGVAHSCSRTELNTKEATVDLLTSGEWRLFFEFARDGRSCIGLAVGPGPQGPWTELADPLAQRADRFDCFHLSTGPLVDFGEGDLVMFYNGSDRGPRWCIGWASFDRETLALRERCEAPLIDPAGDDPSDDGQIVFASSALLGDDGALHLYYSRDDKRPRRATLRRR